MSVVHQSHNSDNNNAEISLSGEVSLLLYIFVVSICFEEFIKEKNTRLQYQSPLTLRSNLLRISLQYPT